MNTIQKIISLLFCSFIGVYSFAQKNEIWGVTRGGGPSDQGVIFKTDSIGNNLTIMYDFPALNASEPGGMRLCEHPNGKLYGTTNSTARRGYGTIFEFDPVLNETTILLSFDTVSGRTPNSGMILGPNGILYGNTVYGGVNGHGSIFSYDPTNNNFTTVHSFNDSTTGRLPVGKMLLANNGKMYGLTSYSNFTNYNSSLYELDPLTNVVTSIVSFNNQSSGQNPIGSLIQAANGKFYGLTNSGGLNGKGVLFEYDILLDTVIVKVDFNLMVGENPLPVLFEASNGKLYGATSRGGLFSRGTLYEYSISSDTIVKKYDFSYFQTASAPVGGFIEDTIGSLIGINNSGVFTYNYLSDSLIETTNFGSINGGNAQAGLIKTSNGKYFGALNTINGSTHGGIFEFRKDSNNLLVRTRFNYNKVGGQPVAKLFQADNGLLYGSTIQGGEFGGGTVFEYSPFTNTIRKIADLYFEVQAELIQASNRKLYGIGVIGRGLIFEIDLDTDSFSIAYIFNTSQLNAPIGKLTEASNGKLYGVAKAYLSGGVGGIYEYDISADTIIEHHLFITSFPGFYSGGLVESNGKLYGTNSTGGSNGRGTLYEFDFLTNTYSDKHHFDSSHRLANGNLLEVSNGVFFGITRSGGTSNRGIIYEYNLASNSFTTKSSFYSSTTGLNPVEGLIKGINNNTYYGLSALGGANGFGVMYEFNSATNSHVGKHQFDGYNTGTSPLSALTNITLCQPLYDTIQVIACNSYQAPSGRIFLKSGSYTDIFSNPLGCDSIVRINLTMDTVNITATNLSQNTLSSNAFNATYQWLDCNNNYAVIPNETGQLFTAVLSGNYAVEVTSTINGCIDTSACFPITLVGIDENEFGSQIALFPNPTSDHVTIALGAVTSGVTTQVYNMYGKLISELTHDAVNQIDVTLGESNGVYFIHLISGRGERVVKKVIKN
tara:strand:+ start:979 stop:3804 length:2826 start_codon:yes stop_codon:yes gene_type:complete